MVGPKADAILAETGVKKKKKKKKPKDGVGSGMIVDDDFGLSLSRGKEDEEEEREDQYHDGPVVAVVSSFKTAKSSAWTTISTGPPPKAPSRGPTPEEDKPLLVVTERQPMKGGLQSESDMQSAREQIESERLALAEMRIREKERKKQAKEAGEESDEADQTVYRDKSGRKIDTKREKAELAKKKREDTEREMKKMQWGKGLVQRGDEERRKKEEEEMKFKPMARYADDKEMNDELMEKDRWNDPAAAFLTKKKKKTSSVPTYTGPPPPPNRFNIPPGYRWDGVDRSNGFEKQLMQKGNERKVNANAGHMWSVEDM